MNKKILFLFVGLISCLTACKLWSDTSESTASTESTMQETPKFVIVNVLDKKLYDDAHIKGSIQVDFTDLKDFAEKNWDKATTEIVLHCSNYKCTASWQGAQQLTNAGFKKVSAYEGGTAEAHQHGLTQGPAREAYLEDFERPEGLQVHEGVNIIDVETLKNKIEEFAL